MQIILRITETVIKYFILFFLLNKSDIKDIMIKKLKSTSNGEILKPFLTVTNRIIILFIKFNTIKNVTNK